MRGGEGERQAARRPGEAAGERLAAARFLVGERLAGVRQPAAGRCRAPRGEGPQPEGDAGATARAKGRRRGMLQPEPGASSQAVHRAGAAEQQALKEAEQGDSMIRWVSQT